MRLSLVQNPEFFRLISISSSNDNDPNVHFHPCSIRSLKQFFKEKIGRNWLFLGTYHLKKTRRQLFTTIIPLNWFWIALGKLPLSTLPWWHKMNPVGCIGIFLNGWTPCGQESSYDEKILVNHGLGNDIYCLSSHYLDKWWSVFNENTWNVFNEYYSKWKSFYSWNCTLKCRLQKGCPCIGLHGLTGHATETLLTASL